MRGSKAKKIRGLAQKLSVGMDKVKYTDKAQNPRKPTRRTRFLYECTRLINRNLKRKFPKGVSVPEVKF